MPVVFFYDASLFIESTFFKRGIRRFAERQQAGAEFLYCRSRQLLEW
jgi:hypothetical protein